MSAASHGLLHQLCHRVLRVLGVAVALAVLWIVGFWNVVAVPAGPPRILLIGDPQIMGTDGSLYGDLNMQFNDYYMRWVLWRATSVVQPTHAVVLGDIVSTHDLDDGEWRRRMRRWRWIARDLPGPVVNVSGNHDIGYAVWHDQRIYERWTRAFGALNGELRLNDKHTLVWVNAMVLDSPYHQEAHAAAWAMIERPRPGTTVLLCLHIPLHKDAGQCPGDVPYMRRSGNAVVEQNLLSPESSQRILATRPEAIFSGHDHVGCVHRHNEHTTEYTLRAIQAEYWGYTGVYAPPGQFAGAFLLHNTPFIVAVISIPVYVALVALFSAVTWCCGRTAASRTTNKND